LWSHTEDLYKQLLTLIDEHVEIPRKILVIASHFGLAHQLSALKKRLYEERKIKLLLVVQVTDDSPQQIWYVPGADLILVPSSFTHRQLAQYGRMAGLAPADFQVLPYPVSPLLSGKLSSAGFSNRLAQLDPAQYDPIHICIPISGAAVGTEYFRKLIEILSTKSDRFKFHIVSKSALFTKEFLSQIMTHQSVRLYVSQSDREVVKLYDQVYEENVIALEITKPSEQAFKALLTPKMSGGALLLFSAPIGRQEYDNLFFLRRHHLMPTEDENLSLLKNISGPQNRHFSLLKQIHHWRALRLPDDAQMAADFIYRLHKNKILSAMTKWIPPKSYVAHLHELGSDGVAQFWKTVFAKFDL
jgi:hypothetical protein